MHSSILIILALLYSIFNPCAAQVYKYQDEQGNWYYSDRPPPDNKTAEILEEAPKKAEEVINKKSFSSNIKVELYEKFRPKTPTEEATLSVVSIETPMVSASGFFVSEDGYIITNKHVVKPSESPQWQEMLDSVKEKENDFFGLAAGCTEKIVCLISFQGTVRFT